MTHETYADQRNHPRQFPGSTPYLKSPTRNCPHVERYAASFPMGSSLKQDPTTITILPSPNTSSDENNWWDIFITTPDGFCNRPMCFPLSHCVFNRLSMNLDSRDLLQVRVLGWGYVKLFSVKDGKPRKIQAYRLLQTVLKSSGLSTVAAVGLMFPVATIWRSLWQ